MRAMSRRLILFAFVCLGPYGAPARAKDFSPIPERTAQLQADLQGPHSATEVLTQWCGDLGFAAPPLVKALVVHGADKKPSRDVRALLQAKDNLSIRYRRVRLACGGHVLSEADNWYRPDKLTPGMNRELDTTDTSFGAVVRPLNFHRKTLAIEAADQPHSVLQVRALLLTGAGVPFSLVVEDYSRELVTAAPQAHRPSR
jgi:hypothetical protein